MSTSEKPGNELYRAKIWAGWVSVAFLFGFLYIAVDRGPNQAYIVLVVVAIIAVSTGLIVSMARRKRHRDREFGS